MKTLLASMAALSLAAAAFAPQAAAQTSITLDHTGGTMIRTRFSIELRDASGKPSGRSVVDHPGMGIRAEVGYVPLADVATLEGILATADLANQPAVEHTGEKPDVGSRKFTDENGDYCTLVAGRHSVDAQPIMLKLDAAVGQAMTDFVAGAAPAATPFLKYEFWADWPNSQVTLEVLSDGSYTLDGQGKHDTGTLSAQEINSLEIYMRKHAKTWARYPKSFGRPLPGASSETITYTDAAGNATSVARFGPASMRSKATFSYLEHFFRAEALALEPTLKF